MNMTLAVGPSSHRGDRRVNQHKSQPDERRARALMRSPLLTALLVVVAALAAGSPVAAVPQVSAAVPAPAAEKRRIRTVIVDNYRPYSFSNDRGEPDGFSVEILRAIAKTIGLEAELRIDTWENAKQALEDGAIDVLPMMAYSAARDKLFDFSAPHTIAFDSIFVKKGSEKLRSLADLTGKIVIVMNKDLAHEYLLAHGFDTRMNLVLVDSLPEALRRLAAGKADAAIMPKLVGLVLAGELGFTPVLSTSEVIEEYTRPFSFAVRGDNPQLLERLNYGLSILHTTGEYAALSEKWFAALEKPRLDWKTALGYALLLITVCLVLSAWNWLLRRQVRAQAGRLATSQKLLIDIADNSGSLIYALDTTGRFLFINRNLEAVFGASRKTLIGKARETFLPPQIAAAHRANDLQVIAARQPMTFEEVSEETDGKHTYLSVKFPLLDEHGTPYGVGGVSTDITARKQAEQERLSHLGFLVSLEKVDQALRQAVNLESMMTDVLGAALSIFACDRAWLIHPCDPESQVWSVRTEQTRPEYPGALIAGSDLPLTPDVRQSFLELLNSRAPLVYDPQSGRSLPQAASQFSVQSQIQTAVYPKSGKPWVFGLHQCSHARVWNETDVLLFTEIARRLTDGLSSMLFRQELQKSEEIFNQFMEHSPIYVFFKDELMRSLRLSRNFEAMLGRPIAELLGKSMDELFPSALAKSMVADDIRIMAERKVVTVEEEFNGHFYSTTKFPIVIEGRPRYLAGFTIDVTERKTAAEKLLKERDFSRAALGALPGIVYLFDAEGRFLRWNKNFEQVSGYTAEELGRMSPLDFFVEPDRAAVRQKVAEAFEKGSAEIEARFTFKSGGHAPYFLTGRLIDVEGKACLIGMGVDVTERKRLAQENTRLEDQLRQAQKVEAIGRLAGGVAHDFNNMTAIVLGYGDLLLSRLGPKDPSRAWVEQIVEAGRRSATLTRQLLAFSRKQVLLPVVLDLNELLRNLEKMLGRLIGEDIELTFDLAGDLGRVTVDPGQIEQVVLNLAINARDAMPQGGKLTIETANAELDVGYAKSHLEVVPGDYVLLALTDTGCGMDKAHLARLFEPFFTTKEMGKGTGLGLATSYGIVKQSGGYIWAYSEPGKGATFKIYLPRTASQPTPVLDAGEEAPRGRGELILLVEDEKSLREMGETVLRQLGYRVSTAGNGPGAMALLAASGQNPDLVITDVIMPCMSGRELAQRLRESRPELKVLYMSGYPAEAITSHGVFGQGIDFIQKPFSERALARKVREVLGVGAAGAPAGRHVLMIDDDAQFRELVGRFCTKRGHYFEGVESAGAALAALAASPFDVLLVDLNIPGTTGEQVLREIRAAGHTAPAIVLTGDLASADMAALGPLGVVQALEKSSSAGPLLHAIETTAENRPRRETGAS